MLGRLFEQRALTSGNVWGNTSPSAPWGAWPGDSDYGIGGGSSNPLHLTTVLGCVRLISDSISTLPVDVYRKSGSQKVNVSPPDWLMEPIVGLDFASWCGQVLSSLLLEGNSYILVGRGASGSIVELRPLDAGMVQIIGGRYYVNGRPAEILHIRGLMLAGSNTGLSPVGLARTTIGLGMSALRYGQDYFDGDGNMPGVIESAKPMQPATKTDIALHWQRKRRKGGKGLPGVLDDGATWKPIGMSNEDAQFLATRNYTAAEIAGQIFLLDPADLGIAVTGTSLTYANLDQRNARRVQVTFLPWMTRIETAISRMLASPRYMKFNVEGLLRGDMKTRYESYEIGIRSQFIMPNEARDLEDLPPIDGGDSVVAAPTVEPAAREADVTNIHVTIPPAERQDPPVVNVTTAKQDPPVVNVTVPPAERQEAPVVNVTTPEIVVNIPEYRGQEIRTKRQTVEHTPDGRIAAIVTEEVVD